MPTWNVVSADSHLESHPMGWIERLPARLRADAPQIVELPDGSGSGWQIGDKPPVPFGLSCSGGLKYSEFKMRRTFEVGVPGTGDPAQRLAEQDQDGVDGEILFASPFIGMLKAMSSAELQRESCAAFNDWLDDYCSYAPDRLFGAGLIPFTSIDDAVGELNRIAEKSNVRGAQLLKFPSGSEMLSAEDDMFWAAAEDIGICVMGHHNFGGRPNTPAGKELQTGTEIGIDDADARALAYLMCADVQPPANPLLTILQLFMSGTLDRYPRLRFHFAETGIGWLPYWLEQMEDRYDRNRFWSNVNLDRRPTEYLRDHFTFSFQEDHAGVALRHSIGIDNICWASDFPHSVSDWPWSVETRARQFDQVPDHERRQIEALNILAQIGIITADEKAAMATAPIEAPRPEVVLARGERRM